jgi:hypothetical protein
MPLSQVQQDQEDVFFLLYNGINLFCKTLFDRYKEVNDLTVNNLDTIEILSSGFLYGATLSLVLLSFILLFYLVKANYTKKSLLQPFLDIPEKRARSLNNKCLSFLTFIQAGEDEEILSEVDLLSN